MSDNVVIWADIPVLELPRAMKFYADVTGEQVLQFPGMDDVAVIGNPADGPLISADLYVGKPSRDGVTVYLNTRGDIHGMLARAVEAGGEVVREVAFMGDMVGLIAVFIDSEGNRIGLQQQTKGDA